MECQEASECRFCLVFRVTVSGFGFRVSGLGFRVSGFRVLGCSGRGGLSSKAPCS